MSMESLYAKEPAGLYDVCTRREGPQGQLPLTDEMLRMSPSGNIFGMTINAGMGWNPDDLAGGDVLIISTQGGIRRDDGTTVAVGLHNGHFELGGLMRSAAEELKAEGYVPHAAFVTD
ncbi:MAG: YjhG/YagF family D-xylonate dehydratase, partial [Selenomonas artemidis]|nr:YjhG/YagF family D-xylonate dehydratase [Selenomonas artemidis]